MRFTGLIVIFTIAITSNTFAQEQWSLVGPYKWMQNNTQWSGYVSQVLADPRSLSDNPDKDLLLGTETSGIFKYVPVNDTDFTWKCVTDSLQVGGLGVFEMVRSRNNVNHIMAATGIAKHSYVTYSNKHGLLYSSNNGDSWEGFPDMFPGFNSSFAITRFEESHYPKKLNKPFQHFFIVTKHVGSSYLLEYKQGTWVNHTNTLPESFQKGKDRFIINDFEEIGKNTYLLCTKSPHQNNAHVYIGKRYAHQYHIKWKEVAKKHFKPSNSNNSFLIASNLDKEQWIRSGNLDFFVSTNNGLRWKKHTLTELKHKGSIKTEIMKSPNSDYLYLAGIQPGVYHTKTGKTTNFYAGHADVRDFSYSGIKNGVEIVYLANDGGVSRVEIDTATTKTSFTALNGNQLAIQELWGLEVSQSQEEFIVTGAMHNNSFVLENGEWKKIGCGDGGRTLILNDTNKEYLHTCNQRLYKGHTYIGSNNHWFLNGTLIHDPIHQDTVYYIEEKKGSKQAQLISFNHQTREKNKRLIPYTDFNNASCIAISTLNPNRWYIAEKSIVSAPTINGKLLSYNKKDHVFKDLGLSIVYSDANLTDTLGSLRSYTGWTGISDILLHPKKENEILICIHAAQTHADTITANKKSVLKSTDGGKTFYEYSNGLPGFPLNSLELHIDSSGKSTYFAGSDIGIFKRSENDTKWMSCQKNLPLSPITDIKINQVTGTLYVSTFGRSIWKINLAELLR